MEEAVRRGLIPYPGPDARRKLRDRSKVYRHWRHYCPHGPHPKQQLFLDSQHVPELGFGGQAGGGKSDAQLMDALQYVHVPGYASILFRRTHQDLALPGALMDRSKAWFMGKGVRWNEQLKKWTFPSGATISFGYLATENDKYRYQSAEFQHIGFDELSQFYETQYLYLFSRLRRLMGVNIPIRMRATFNPGGIGHEWVRERFIRFDPLKFPRRKFIASSLADNPSLDAEEYIASLGELDIITRAQLLEGDWDISAAGKVLQRSWFKTITVNHVPPLLRKVMGVDLAASIKTLADFTVGLPIGLDKDNNFYIFRPYRMQSEWPDSRREIANRALASGVNQIGVESMAFQLAAIQDLRREQSIAAISIVEVPADRDKLARVMGWSPIAEQGRFYLVDDGSGWVDIFLDECQLFPLGEHDDQVDAVGMAMALFSVADELMTDDAIYRRIHRLED